jgi:hypothetical protein
LPDAGTTAADGIYFGTTITLFRNSNNRLQCISSFQTTNLFVDDIFPVNSDIRALSYRTFLLSPSTLTGSSATSALSIAQTWNTTGNPTAILLNVTNTASGTTANLMDLQVTGASRFKVDKNGNSIINGITVGTGGGNISTNTVIGATAGRDNTTGAFNSFFGQNAGRGNTTGANNSFFGFDSGLNTTTGGSNSFFGVFTGRNNTTGVNNSFIGLNAGRDNTTGGSNSFFGSNAGLINTTGSSNSFFGVNSGLNNTTGGSNSFFGLNAGRYIADGTTSLTVASSSVFIGGDTRANADNQTNQIVIGNTVIGNGSNTVTLGNLSITNTYLRGNINLTDSANIVIDTTTGTKIGTSTSQKIGLWNATPIVQPTTSVAAAAFVANSGPNIHQTSTFDGYTVEQVVKALRNIGILA